MTYTIDEVELERNRTTAKTEVKNQHGDMVAVGRHILKWVLNVAGKA